DPRVRRQIQALRAHYQVIAAGMGDPNFSDVRVFSCEREMRRAGKKCWEGLELLFRRYESYYWKMEHVQELRRKLQGFAYDAVIANDLEALPLGLLLAGNRPVIIDAHEYAPRESEDRIIWRIFKQGFAYHLCAKYLPRAR